MPAQTISKILTFKFIDIKKVGQSHVVQLHNETIQWQITKSTKVVPCIFVLTRTISKILTFPTVYLRKVGQDHGV